MKILLLSIVLVLASAHAETLQSTSGMVQGTVKRTDNGEPIANVQVTINRAENLPQARVDLLSAFPSGMQMTPPLLDAAPLPFGPDETSATSDAMGHFIFKSVPAGTWVIHARLEGYTAPSFNGALILGGVTTTPIHVVDRQPATNISLLMAPAGTISGRVSDPNGQPVAGLIVAAYQYTYANGGRAILNSRTAKRTDDHGNFRLFWLAPGEYIIAVTPTASGSGAMGTFGENVAYARTFSPGTIDSDLAEKIIVKEGEKVEGKDIHLRARTTVKVSGRVINTVPSSTPDSFFYLVPRDPKDYPETGGLMFHNMASDLSKGHFEIRNVPPGHYDLITSVSNAKGGTTPGRTAIDVGDVDLREVTLTIHPGVDVKARLSYVGGTPAIGNPALQIAMLAWENYAAIFNPPMVMVSEGIVSALTPGGTIPDPPKVDFSGATLFPDKPEARYKFQVSGLPPTAYVADVRESGVSIFDSGLHVGDIPPGEIEIVVNLAGSTVVGAVFDAAQKPVHLAKVVLVPQLSRRGNTDLYRTAFTNPAGQFTLHGVPPGTYKAFAWQYPPSNYAWQNAGFIAKYEARGRTVTVLSPGVADLQLQVIP